MGALCCQSDRDLASLELSAAVCVRVTVMATIGCAVRQPPEFCAFFLSQVGCVLLELASTAAGSRNVSGTATPAETIIWKAASMLRLVD